MASAQYEYTPLKDPASQIRLLEVSGDANDSSHQTKCLLTTWHVDRAPEYHAISYTWGPEEPTENILLNDASTTIRKNCADVLRQLLYFKSSRYYWIDALCIDQKSIDEKNHQVARMGQIYSLAAHVLVCLGEYDDDAEDAFDIISQLWHRYFPPTSEASHVDTIGRLPISGFVEFPGIDPNRFALSLETLTRRPYFQRVWIVQELILAQSVSIYCGHFQLLVLCPYTDLLLRAAAAYKVQIHDTFARQKAPVMSDKEWVQLVEVRNWQDRRVLHLLRQRWRLSERGEKSSFGEALELFSSLQCQDPRDKVYGTLGLIDWRDAPPIEPDYSKSRYDLAVECLYRLYAQKHFALVDNQKKFADAMRQLEVTVYAGELGGNEDQRIFDVREKLDQDYTVFAFRKDPITKCYKPSIGLLMFGMPLSEVWHEPETMTLSYNGKCNHITYAEVFDSAEAIVRSHRLVRDPLEVRKSDWILSSRRYGDILVGKYALDAFIPPWNIVGRVSICSSSTTILEAKLTSDGSKREEFLVWCDPGDGPDFTQVGAWLDSRLRSFECYGYAVSRSD